MAKKEEYKLKNEKFLMDLRAEEEVHELPCGILYRVVQNSGIERHPQANSIVTVHYTGSLINGRVFDDSRTRSYPEAFRLREVITGWQIALQNMNVVDRWIVYIPAAVGYGSKTSGPSPGNSTLIFDVELLGIA